MHLNLNVPTLMVETIAQNVLAVAQNQSIEEHKQKW
jgi:hypothetical protein